MADVLKPIPPPEKKPADSVPPATPTTEPKGSEDDLSEEDKVLAGELDMLIERLREPNPLLYDPALETLRTLIKASTTSMTSVPKPLKFLRKHYPTLKEIYEKLEGDSKKKCADIISVLGMTISTTRECLQYKLLGVNEEIGEWGHEYVRHLAGEISQEWWESKELTDKQKDELMELAKKIIPYNLIHNAEAEACDLAMELEKLEILEEFVEEDPHQRVCAYLVSCVAYVPDPENSKLLRTAYNVYRKFQQWPQALRVAMQLNKIDDIKDLVEGCPDPIMRKQLAFMIGRQQLNVEFPETISNSDQLTDIVTNTLLNVNFLALGRELDILEPKTPDEIYKSHLDGPRSAFGSQVDSARQNLASSFVSGFVNAGFGRDKLLTEDGNKWLYKNKEHGMLSAAASLGLILLWDVDGGLSQIDKYLYSAEDYIKAGALLACGIVNCGVRSECDPALALLTDYVNHQSPTIRTGAILGLGLAYAGTNRDDVLKILHSAANDIHPGMEVLGISCLAVGLISVGTCNIDITTLIVQCLMERSDEEWRDPYIRYCCLGLGLCCLGRQEEADVVAMALEVLPENFRNMAVTILEICAYAGTGNVLKIQKLLHICSEHFEPPAETKKEEEKKKSKDKDKNKKDSKDADKPHYEYLLQQSAATLGIALIAMGEDIGTEMAFRTFGHLLRYGEPSIRKAVPLALGLLSVSNPRLTVLDTLSKFSHDLDSEVALNSIFAMGIVGAGTNNARVAAMLRQLSQYHVKDSNHLFMVRLAQGLVHLGKGTLGLSPFHSDRQLLSPVAMGGLLCTLFAFLDVRGTILGKGHYMLYCLAPAMNPRMLATFDENLEPLPIAVRVGQAVDTVGVAGKPKTITGFQTYTTPVLLGHGERAELATDDYLALSPILEGFVILRKNPAAARLTVEQDPLTD